MRTACKSQCPQCPFRPSSLPGWLGGYKGPGAIHSSLWHKEPFFCHTRNQYEHKDWLRRLMANGRLCSGALLAISRDTWFPKPDDPDLEAARQEVLAMYRLTPTAYEVMTWPEFMKHHSGGVTQEWLATQRITPQQRRNK